MTGRAMSRAASVHAFLCLLLLRRGSGYGAYQNSFRCNVPDAYTDAELQDLTSFNCAFVDAWTSEVDEAIAEGLHEIVTHSEEQRAAWKARSGNASDACWTARSLDASGDHLGAANLSINAWGSIVRQGATCCTLLHPPYCVDQDWSASTVALLAPLAFLAFLFAGVLLASCRAAPQKEPAGLSEGAGAGRGAPAPAASASRRRELQALLESAWLEGHCLRALPHAALFAGPTASLFAGLTDAFQFQEDNAKNQHEHLLSLWRSQLSMVADRAYEGAGAEVDEQGLLREALGDLHAELLDGFLRWREAFYGFEGSGMEAKGGLPPMCGASWEPLRGVGTGDADEELSRQLAEVVAFLLVWGEAGNLRFMPEVVYFITDLVLSSEPHDLSELYQLQGQPTGDSGLFLARIVRPMYNSIFDEWYDKVDVHPGNQKDVKKLRDGFDAYLPGNVANYDDWNELFCDPARLAEGLLLQERAPGSSSTTTARGSATSQWGASADLSPGVRHEDAQRAPLALGCVRRHAPRLPAAHAPLRRQPVRSQRGPAGGGRGQAPPGRRHGGRALRRRRPAGAPARTGLVVRTVAGHRGGPAQQVGPVRPVPELPGRGEDSRALGSLCRPLCGCPGTGARCLRGLVRRPPLLVFLAPLATFALLRWSDVESAGIVAGVAALHYLTSAFGLVHLLLVPSTTYDRFPFESRTPVPLSSRVVRYGFWGPVADPFCEVRAGAHHREGYQRRHAGFAAHPPRPRVRTGHRAAVLHRPVG
ncbi:unnamed protein product [Prorocentrum cordatum]|uniref:1,3-beta-glucan synthase component FKS1-like domain-containing protein n=1 Tax=Prorocentrum cordatum TaxID=2364126 RepID=A0ABN9QKB2_9DINO|nr:unnamed protein product [Polarella glacialis]